MELLLIILLALAMNAQSVFSRLYHKTIPATVDNAAVLTVFRCLIMAVLFAVTAGFAFTLHRPTMVYAAVYGGLLAVNLTVCTIGLMLGPIGLSTLIVSFSMIVVSLYGIVFLQEPLTWQLAVGIGMIAVSMVLLYEKEPSGTKLSLPWAICVAIAFVANGACTITQKLHQIAFPGQFIHEFMIVGSLVCVAGSLLLAAGYRALAGKKEARAVSERVPLRECFRRGWAGMLGIGISCYLVNFLLMVLNSRSAASFLFTTLSGLSILLSAALSRFVYHEPMSTRQRISFVIGLAAVILMNL